MSDADPPNRAQGRKRIAPSLKPRALMEDGGLRVDLWTAQVLTLFPEAFPGTLGLSLTGRALKDRLWQLDTIGLRDFGMGRHRTGSRVLGALAPAPVSISDMCVCVRVRGRAQRAA